MTSEPTFDDVKRNVQNILQILTHTDERQMLSLLIRGDLSSPDTFRRRLSVESPAKMRFYLLALLMQTKLESPVTRLSDKQLEELFRSLYEIEFHYRFDIFRQASQATLPQRIAALGIALSWFFSVELVSVENVQEISQNLFFQCDKIANFDNTLGIPTDNALEMFAFINYQLHSQLRSLPVDHEPYLLLKDSLSDKNIDDDLLDPFSISIEQLEIRFGEQQCISFMKAFSVERGLKHTYLYPVTSKPPNNPVEERPLILSSGRLFLTSRNALHLSLYRRYLEAIRQNQQALTLRKNYTEAKVAEIFKRFFPTATIVASACENNQRQYEHDLVILYENALLVVEVKGGGPIPPRVEVDEAVRELLNRAQPGLKSSKTSPFHAISQAQRLIQIIKSATSPVSLYNYNNRNLLIEIDPLSLNNFFAIAVTLESYGPVTTDWDLLGFIDKNIGSPWSITIADLDAFAYALLDHKGLDGKSLIKFLTERIDCHGKLRTFDELDFAEEFLLNGSLRAISSAKKPLSPDNLRRGLFDEIEAARRKFMY